MKKIHLINVMCSIGVSWILSTDLHATSVDPDAFGLGSNISIDAGIIEEVNLSLVDQNGNWLSHIFATDPQSPMHGKTDASTESLTFGHSWGNYKNTFFNSFDYPAKIFKASFSSIVSSVSIDFIGNDTDLIYDSNDQLIETTDIGFISAYDKDDNLLETYYSSALMGNTWETGTVTGNISYILAGGIDINSSLGLDYLQYKSYMHTPEPSTVILFGLGIIFLGMTNRRQKKR